MGCIPAWPGTCIFMVATSRGHMTVLLIFLMIFCPRNAFLIISSLHNWIKWIISSLWSMIQFRKDSQNEFLIFEREVIWGHLSILNGLWPEPHFSARTGCSKSDYSSSFFKSWLIFTWNLTQLRKHGIWKVWTIKPVWASLISDFDFFNLWKSQVHLLPKFRYRNTYII